MIRNDLISVLIHCIRNKHHVILNPEFGWVCLIVVTQRLLNSFDLLPRDNQIHISLGDFEIVSSQLLGDASS